MAAIIVINQATRPAGVAGESRSDGVISQAVTCSNSSPESSYLWTLVDVPIRSALVRGTTGTSATFLFTPDVKGTYLVSLQVNGSVAPADNASLYISVASAGTKALGWRYKAANETIEDNEKYVGLGFPSDINERGWATNEDLVQEEIETSVWETQNAVTSHIGLHKRLVATDAATGKVDASLLNFTDTGITQLTGGVTAGPGNGSQAATVVKVQAVAVSGTAPTSGQVLTAVDATNAQWQTPIDRGDTADVEAVNRFNGNGYKPGYAGIDHTHDGSQVRIHTYSGAAGYILYRDYDINQVDTTAYAANCTLFAPETCFFVIQKTGGGANGITLKRYASENIMGTAADYLLPGSDDPFDKDAPQAWCVYSNGTDWFVM